MTQYRITLHSQYRYETNAEITSTPVHFIGTLAECEDYAMGFAPFYENAEGLVGLWFSFTEIVTEDKCQHSNQTIRTHMVGTQADGNVVRITECDNCNALLVVSGVTWEVMLVTNHGPAALLYARHLCGNR